MPNKLFGYLVYCIMLSLVLCACNSLTPAIPQTPTQASTLTPNPTNTPTPTHTFTPTPSTTPTVTIIPSPTSSPAPTSTPIGGKTSFLAFIGRDKNNSYNLYVVNMYNGEIITKETLVYDLDPGWEVDAAPMSRGGFYSISWSGDASKIIFNTGGFLSNSIELFDNRTQTLKKIVDLPLNSGTEQFIWSPENTSWVAYKLATASRVQMYRNIWFVDLSQESIYPVSITEKTSFNLHFNWSSDGLKLWSIIDTGLGLIIREFNPSNGNTQIIIKTEEDIVSRITKHMSPSGTWEFIKHNPLKRSHSSIIDWERNNSVLTNCLVIGFLGWSPDEKSSVVFCFKERGVEQFNEYAYKQDFEKNINAVISEVFQIAVLENSTGNILYFYSFPTEITPMIPLYNYHLDNLGWGLGIGWK